MWGPHVNSSLPYPPGGALGRAKPSDVLSWDFLSIYNSCKWVYFQKVASFAIEKIELPTHCFLYVPSFVLNVAFALLADMKSPCSSRFC